LQISVLEAAAAVQDAAQLRSAAHHLRGGCLQLGAQALAALCAQIEYADAQPVPAEIVAQVRTCYRLTCALISQRYPQGS
jgi:HPt (histidine-containing phosphotransfer) domain-containing protein